MTLDTVFSLSTFLVIPFWYLMICLPAWKWTKRILGSPWIIAPAAALYLALVLPDAPSVFIEVSHPDLASIAALLATLSGATIAWVHFSGF